MLQQTIHCTSLEMFIDCVDSLVRRNINFTARIDPLYFIINITGY